MLGLVMVTFNDPGVVVSVVTEEREERRGCIVTNQRPTYLGVVDAVYQVSILVTAGVQDIR